MCADFDCPTRPSPDHENTTPGHVPGKPKKSANTRYAEQSLSYNSGGTASTDSSGNTSTGGGDGPKTGPGDSEGCGSWGSLASFCSGVGEVFYGVVSNVPHAAEYYGWIFDGDCRNGGGPGSPGCDYGTQFDNWIADYGYDINSDSYQAPSAVAAIFGARPGAVPNNVKGTRNSGLLSDPLPLRNKGFSNHFANAYDDIRMGRGRPVVDENGHQKIFEGRKTHEKPWAGAKEWHVPGITRHNEARILELPISGGRTVMGWTNDHYGTIHRFTGPHFPDAGWK